MQIKAPIFQNAACLLHSQLTLIMNIDNFMNVWEFFFCHSFTGSHVFYDGLHHCKHYFIAMFSSLLSPNPSNSKFKMLGASSDRTQSGTAFIIYQILCMKIWKEDKGALASADEIFTLFFFPFIFFFPFFPRGEIPAIHPTKIIDLLQKNS